MRSLPVVVLVLLIACGVDSITGPTTVTAGQNAAYDYAWSYVDLVDPNTSTNASAEVTVVIPAGWTVVSATYSGTVNGGAVSGTATPFAPPGCGAPILPGYQALAFSAGPFATAVKGDSGAFHITYTVGGAPGTYMLEGRGSATTSTLTSACGNAATPLQVTVQAGAALGVSKAFTPATVAPSSPSTLRITITNSNAFAASGVAFTDTYPLGLVNAAVPGGASTCGGTVTAAAGGNTVALSGGTVPASGSCSVSVAVSSGSAATYDNTLPAGAVTSTNVAANPAPATASLTVGSAAASIPALDGSMLALLAAALAVAAFFALRR
ncbi:MAG: DUF7933 domain-containing protein [Thermoanaerobaculia bacterium]